MKTETAIKKYSNIRNLELLFLPMISSAAVLRNERVLRELLQIAAIKNYDGIKIYEALLQTYLFAGFPNALLSLQMASEYFKPADKYSKYSESVIRQKGTENCKKIYGNKFAKLISNVSSFSPELSDWLIMEGYGKVFGRNGLSLKDRELCNVAVLASLKYESQLFSHINGAYRLHNSHLEIAQVIDSLLLTGGRTIYNFGTKVFENYLEQKGIK